MKNPPFPIEVPAAQHQGEFHADVTRDTYRQHAGFLRVIAQQGRPILDADLNEQTSILLHYLQCFIVDIAGPWFRPTTAPGFWFTFNDKKDDLIIGQGRFYVDGLLCENPKPVLFSDQPFALPLGEKKTTVQLLAREKEYYLYLDAWERHLTVADYPVLSDVALGGTDTASRSQVAWQVKLEEFNSAEGLEGIEKLVQVRNQPRTGRLSAQASANKQRVTEACLASPQAGYRGVENQLYRVEVHGVKDNKVKLKWSRDNASIKFAVKKLDGARVQLAERPRDARFTLQEKDWVELVDEHPSQVPSLMVRVAKVDWEQLEVTLDLTSAEEAVSTEELGVLTTRADKEHLFLRKWDQSELSELTVASSATDGWKELERGISVRLSVDLTGQPANSQAATFSRGDYWLIPARVATGGIEWPTADDKPVACRPHGVLHRYAPLASLRFEGQEWKISNFPTDPGDQDHAHEPAPK